MTDQKLSHREKCDLIANHDLHCTVAQFDALLDELKRRANSHRAHDNGIVDYDTEVTK